MTKINNYLRMPTNTKLLLIEAFFWSIVAKVAIEILPLKYYQQLLLTNQSKTSNLQRLEEIDQWVIKIKSVIYTLANNVPWEVKCYSQAIIAKQLFLKKGIHTTLKLGLAKDYNNQLVAHAWLLWGDQCITGGRNRYQFTPIAEFN